MNKATPETTPSGIVLMDPALIHYDPAKNSRYALKSDRIKTTAQSIVEVGRVIQNLEVEPLPEPINGKLYLLNIGAYRLAAVNQLNKEGAGIKVPVSIVPIGTALDRLNSQVAENIERENQTPMDMSVAAHQYIDAGLSKPEIRKKFKRPGRKEMSNSWLNSILMFSELTKPIQKKIHEGIIDITGAVELTKCKPELREAVVARIEKERAAQIEKEEKDEQKFLDAEKKAADAKVKAEQAEKDRQAAEQAKLDKVKEAEAAKVAAAEKLKEAGAKVAENPAAAKEVAEAAKAVQKADDDLKKLNDKAQAAAKHSKDKADEANKAKAAKGNVGSGAGQKKPTKDKKIGKADVKASAVKEGANVNRVKLDRKLIMDAVREWKLPSGNTKPDKDFQAIAAALEDCFEGGKTPNETFSLIKKILGGK